MRKKIRRRKRKRRNKRREKEVEVKKEAKGEEIEIKCVLGVIIIMSLAGENFDF